MTYTLPWGIASSSSQDPAEDTPKYVNGAQVGMTQWDLAIAFQLAFPAPDSTAENQHFTSQTVVRILVSPTHAKVLADVLAKAISDWESRFGPLPSIEQLTPRVPPEEAADQTPPGGEDA
jgi:hypothetical protein